MPPGPLVFLLAEDELPVAAPVLRTVSLPADTWLALLPRLTPAMRSILRQRRDLPLEAARGLDALGSTDFALADERVDLALPEPEGEEALHDREEVQEQSSGFEIGDIVSRIEAFRNAHSGSARPAPKPSRVEEFKYEADTRRLIRWSEGINRGATVGRRVDRGNRVTLPHWREAGLASLAVTGTSDAAGAWLVTSKPVYDRRTGRLAGFRGVGRRFDDPIESAVPDGMRQMVHELRTPTNAIAGFAEFIETEVLGPAAPVYRERARSIRGEATDLIDAIDDLDMAARIDSNALDLRAEIVALAPLLRQVTSDLSALAMLRGVEIALDAIDAQEVEVAGDERALERLLGRLAAALVAVGRRDERIGIRVERTAEPDGVLIRFDRPVDLKMEKDEEGAQASLLGAAFSLRLAQNLARELGGALRIDSDRLTLRLAVPMAGDMERATSNRR